jgi:drug/metabolite transporter (DMT)-like permease
MSQILFAGVRFTLAGILTILIGSLLRGRLLLPKRGSGGMILTLAMMQTVIQYTFFYIGLSHAPGFKGSIISPTSTFFALLIAALVFRQEKLTARKLLGCLIGFAGVVVVSVTGKLGRGVRLDGEGFLVLAAASYGCSSVLIKRYSTREDPVVLSGWQFLIGGLLMTAAALLGGGKLRAVTAAAWPLMLYLGSLSAVAYTLWSLLLQRHPVSHITVYSFANPVFGVILSALLLGEGKQLDVPRCLLSLLLVSLGVWIVNGGQKENGVKKPKAA